MFFKLKLKITTSKNIWICITCLYRQNSLFYNCPKLLVSIRFYDTFSRVLYLHFICCVYVCACVRERKCVCECVREWESVCIIVCIWASACISRLPIEFVINIFVGTNEAFYDLHLLAASFINVWRVFILDLGTTQL